MLHGYMCRQPSKWVGVEASFLFRVIREFLRGGCDLGGIWGGRGGLYLGDPLGGAVGTSRKPPEAKGLPFLMQLCWFIMVGSVSLVLKSSVWGPQGLSSECIYPNAAIFPLVLFSTVSALSTSDAVPNPYLQPQLLSRTSHLHFKWPVRYLQLGDSSHLKLNVSLKMNLPLSFPKWRRLS